MNKLRKIGSKTFLTIISLFFLFGIISTGHAAPAVTVAPMENYCVVPPFISQNVPPLVMFIMGRDHKMYYEAYNDASDLNDDGELDITYNHSITYYGYFDTEKCYKYDSSGTPTFRPVGFVNSSGFCSAGSGNWNGNLLNWLSMSRIDVLKKVLYGGYRSTDSSSATVLERAYIPQDAHSWGKEYTGRLCANGSTYTNQCITNEDCDSGFSCVDKSTSLTPLSAPVSPSSCTAVPTPKVCAQTGTDCSTDSSVCSGAPGDECVYTNTNDILVVRYNNSSAIDPVDHAELVSTFEPANLIDYFPVTDFSHATLDPLLDHDTTYNIFVVADFEVSAADPKFCSADLPVFTSCTADADCATGACEHIWEFGIDGDDAVELEIDGIVQAGWYGLHSQCGGLTCDINQLSVPLVLSEGWHRLVVRHFERTGQDGVIAYFRKNSTDPYSVFGSTAGINIRAPEPGGADPACPLKDQDFIETGSLRYGPLALGGAAVRHLFCNTTLSANGDPVMRYVTDRTERIWQWASKERPVCNSPGTSGYPFGAATPTDLEVRVEACVPGLLEDNCREYKTSPPTKPSGLMQKYGESLDSVCSLSFKPCNVDADCSGAPEVCIDAGQMYFGLMTGSYTRNLSGGVVRWNIDAITHDIDNRNVGIIQNKGVIGTMNKMALMGFDYGSHSYSDNCGWITTRTLKEGECRMWGNPVGEMMYEATRYFAGFDRPTAAFAAGTGNNGTDDFVLGLPNKSDADNNNTDKDEWELPYQKFPRCAKPFMLVLSDVNPSFDSDQLPGNYAFLKHDGSAGTTPAFTNPAGELANLDVEAEADLIGATEGLNGTDVFVGEVGSTFDSQCTAKNVSTLGKTRGLCPEEPTKQGSYYSAAVAHYAKTEFSNNYLSPGGDPLPNITTYGVAFASPVPKISISNGNDDMTIVPVGTSVSGCLSTYTACANNCTLSYNAAGKGLTISGCSSNAYCPSNQIVDFYVEEIAPDKGRFRINFEDVEQGADHDMDAIIIYEYCVGSACSPSISNSQVKLTLTSSYAAGCIDQALGFVVSGSTADGTYLPIKDGDVPIGADGDTPGTVAGMQTTWTRTFTFSGAPSAKLIENPLWYAAKWGGFVDSDLEGAPGYKIPDKDNEWDEDGDGNPDTYFFVSNPLKLEEQLEKSFLDILRRASSGTAVSVLASGEERGANMLQAVFYPAKLYGKEGGAQADILWTGRMQNLWFYLDPVLGSSNIREDTVKDNVLDLDADYITKLFFDSAENKTRASRCQDVDADGDCETDTSPDTMKTTVDFESLSNIWEVGEKLFLRDAGTYNTDAGARVILTNIGQGAPDDPTLDAFDRSSMGVTDNATGLNLTGLLQAVSDEEARKLIDWVRGVPEAEKPFCSDNGVLCGADSDCNVGATCISYRSRTATLGVCSISTSKFCSQDTDCPVGETCTGERTGTWKLGDIVSSTPRIVTPAPSNDYYNKYNDQTYLQFTQTDDSNRPDINYKGRGMVFVGANDGMLHAIKLGTQERINLYTDKSRIEKIVGTDLGKESWAFIPKHVLPYLKYLAQKDYCHIYSVDATPYIVDASIGDGNAGYENDLKTMDSWRTILIGSMRLGGGCKPLSPATDCTGKNCVNTPLTRAGYSSYFALDITETLAHPDQPTLFPPKLLWEFYNPRLGFSTTGPVVGRIAPKDANGDPENTKNGRWFVVITSGPTGPIDPLAHEFKGRSEQNMLIFVLDLAGNGFGSMKMLKPAPIDTGIPESFGNTSFNSLADIDQRSGSKANYQDDVIYLGYVKKAKIGNVTDWVDGGILRLATKEDMNPNNWALSTLIDGIGPLTATPIKFAENVGDKERFWVLFGSGRYFYRADDQNGRRSIYAVTEPCYNSSVPFDFDPNCTTTLKRTDLDDATSAGVDPLRAYNSTSGFKGWYINLDCSYDDAACPSAPSPFPYNAERIITHPLALARGNKALAYFTSFSPTGDLCGYSGMTYLWATDILTGGAPDEDLLFGKALIQVSTGEIKEINLKDAFVEKKVNYYKADGTTEQRGRRSVGFKGVPPQGQGLAIIGPPEQITGIVHMEEE